VAHEEKLLLLEVHFRLKLLASQFLMHVVDWLPTFASFAGSGHPSTQQPLDGVNQHQALVSVSSPSAREDVFLGFSDGDRKGSALRMGKWKLLLGPPEVRGIQGIVAKLLGPIINDIKTHNYTALGGDDALKAEIKRLEDEAVSRQAGHHADLDGFLVHERLFDVTSDAGETNNLARQYPDVVRDLRSRLEAYHSIAPPHGIDPSFSAQCVDQRPPKHWNQDGPGGAPAMTPYCDLHKVDEVLV